MTKSQVLLLALAVAAAACGKKNKSDDDDDSSTGSVYNNSGGGEGGESQQVGVTGTLVLAPAELRLLGGTGDTVVALPVSASGARAEGLRERAEIVTIDEDGNFELAVSAGEPHVLLVVDSTAADPLDGVLGVIGMTDGDGSLMRLPTDDAIGDFALGDLSVGETGEIGSSMTVADNQASVDASAETLAEVAKTDDSIKHVKNTWANSSADGVYWESKPYVTFSGALQDIDGAYGAPGDVPYHGFGVYMSTNDPRATFLDACGGAGGAEPKTIIEVTPPAALSFEEEDRSTTPPSVVTHPVAVLSNVDAASPEGTADSSRYCGASHGEWANGMYYSGDHGDGSLSFNFGAGGYAGKMPDGAWTVEVNGEAAAKFDMASAHPLDASGNPTVYVPSVKVTKNASGVITRIDAKLYLWDVATSAYVQVTDTTAFAKSTSSFNASLTDYSGGCGGSGRKENMLSDVDPVDGVYTWTGLEEYEMKMITADHNDFSDSSCDAESIAFGYEINGVSLRFDYRYAWN
jgi:hypothetical protein